VSHHSGTDPNILRRVAGEIRKKMDLEASLTIAQKRQRVMLPAEPELPGYEFASTYDPAADISGDFYDYVPLGEGLVGVLQGDVSGHGVEAAIVMGMAKKALSIFARSSSGPKQTLVYGNNDLCSDLDSETFLTVVYATLDGPNARMVLARAGHNIPILFNRKRKPSHRFIKSSGMMVGMYPGQVFEQALNEVTVDLVVGDIVFFYTDGLNEARAPSGEQFGTDRVLDVLDARSKDTPARMLAALRDAATAFRGNREQEDDITMIAFKRTR
jgi:sigma-B regulation protein RsbU (phosphoserine phosphatase)